MELHHTKHYRAYFNGLNAAENAYLKAPSTRDQIALQAALKFNGGGGQALSPRVSPFCSSQQAAPTRRSLEEPRTCEYGGKLKNGMFKDAIVRDFGSVGSRNS